MVVVGDGLHVMILQGHDKVDKRLAGDTKFSQDVTVLAII